MKDLILGMKRALNACENCDGDLDFAIFIIKADIAELEKSEATAPLVEQKDGKK